MVSKITNGIKISVLTNFEGVSYFGENQIRYGFRYEIKIENQSNDVVQLQLRHWKFKDTFSTTEIIDGDGVVGQKPIINPGEHYTYSSGCLLWSFFGVASGHYTMMNLSTAKTFNVKIPTFNLYVPFALN